MQLMTPADVVVPDLEFIDDYHDSVVTGITVAKDARVMVVGLAREIAKILPVTLDRIECLAPSFHEFRVHVVENDSTDGTDEILREWTPDFDFTFDSQQHDRPHLPASRGADRTRPLAEYRQRCVEEAKLYDLDYVIVMDLDAWGGFLVEGIMSSIAHLGESGRRGRLFEPEPDYFGMASIGLGQMPGFEDAEGKPQWFNYDAWAHRPTWSWRQRPEMWFHHWIPPFGCPPIEVNSAFGGLCVYNHEDYIKGQYSGVLFGQGDCEHVAFHRSIWKATGRRMAINPSSVGLMFWQEADDAA